MLEDKKEFICKIKQIVYKNQYYDMCEYFTCKFDMWKTWLILKAVYELLT
jgi:hypothetical protein